MEMEKAEKMSENEKDQIIPKKKTCIWAKISFFSALSVWILAFLALVDLSYPQILDESLFVIFPIFLLALMVISFFSAIIGSINLIIKRNVLKGWLYIVGGFCLLLPPSLFIFMPDESFHRPSPIVMCGTNLSGLSRAILLYNNDYGRYPTADIWCDLLLQNDDVDKEDFICKGALKRGDKGRCHYALNPNCSPHSPPDMVLLFETKAGWNQHGGPELLSTGHHKKRNGCNISFNDSHVNFVEIENLNKWKWDNKPKKE